MNIFSGEERSGQRTAKNRHGGKRKNAGRRYRGGFERLSICGLPDEIMRVRKLAYHQKKTISRCVLDCVQEEIKKEGDESLVFFAGRV